MTLDLVRMLAELAGCVWGVLYGASVGRCEGTRAHSLVGVCCVLMLDDVRGVLCLILETVRRLVAVALILDGLRRLLLACKPLLYRQWFHWFAIDLRIIMALVEGKLCT